MPLKLSVSVRNARLSAIETNIGASPVVKLRTGASPTNITDADSGDVLATITCPGDWLLGPSAGSTTMSGTWSTSAEGTGTAGHFRLYASNGTTQHMQGNVTLTGGGGDMTVDNTSISASQTVTVTTFNLTDGNA